MKLPTAERMLCTSVRNIACMCLMWHYLTMVSKCLCCNLQLECLQALLTARWPSELQYHQKSCIRQLLHVAEEKGAAQAAQAAAVAAVTIPAAKGKLEVT